MNYSPSIFYNLTIYALYYRHKVSLFSSNHQPYGVQGNTEAREEHFR